MLLALLACVAVSNALPVTVVAGYPLASSSNSHYPVQQSEGFGDANEQLGLEAVAQSLKSLRRQIELLRNEVGEEISRDAKQIDDEDCDEACPFLAMKRREREGHREQQLEQDEEAEVNSSEFEDVGIFPLQIQAAVNKLGARVTEWSTQVLSEIIKFVTRTPSKFQPPNPNPHEAGTADVKQAHIWAKVIQNRFSSQFSASLLKTVFLENMDPTVHWTSDELPANRKKVVHQTGVIGKAHMVPTMYATEHYTGQLGNGAKHLIIRLSTNSDPNGEHQTLVPGVAIKFLRDNRPSGNIVAMRETDTGGNYTNFFAPTVQTHLFGTKSNLFGVAVGAKFRQATAYSSYVGVSDLARFDDDGTMIRNELIKHPFQLVLKPNSHLANRQVSLGDDWMTQFEGITPGMMLYDIYAQDEPKGPLSPLLGSLVLDSVLTRSEYGDKTLFFKHQVADEDMMLRPDWIRKCPLDVSCEMMF